MGMNWGFVLLRVVCSWGAGTLGTSPLCPRCVNTQFRVCLGTEQEPHGWQRIILQEPDLR